MNFMKKISNIFFILTLLIFNFKIYANQIHIVKSIDGLYEGELSDIINQIKEGYGTMNYSNGDIYSGEWKSGRKHGKGTMYYDDGSVHIGKWSNEGRSGYGETTSSNYSFIYNKNLVFGYINNNLELDLTNSIFEIEVAKKKYEASVLLKPLHDHENKFIRN